MGLFLRLPFSLRVPLMTAVLMVLVGIFASQQVLRAIGSVQDERIRELAQLQVEALSVALGPQVQRKDVWEIYDTLDRSTRRTEKGRLTFTVVADQNGRVLAATDPKKAPVDSLLKGLTVNVQSLENLSVSGSEPLIRLLADLIYQNRPVGQILIEMSVADLISERRQAAWILILGNAIVIGGLALLGYLGIRRMLLPITSLVERMRESSTMPTPIPENDLPKGDTEMSRLMHSYNSMANAVEAKAEANQRLADRERFVSLGRLSSSLAHEINNPLGGMLNAADTIQKYADRPDVVRNSADLLTRGLGHLRDVARATLDQNRVDRTGSALTLEDFDDLHLLIGPEVSRRAQTLEWAINVDDKMLADLVAGPVRQVALNLLLNATEAAGDKGQITLDVDIEGTTLRLRIANSGPELSKAARERLLGSGPVPPGGGVGLRLVHDLINEMAGTVKAHHRDGMTEIEVILPLTDKKIAAKC